MKLHIFQSAKGDCLLLESKDGAHMLVDGGMRATMKSHVRQELADIMNGRPLDVVYISHIDQDHISGVLQLLQDTLDWRVHDYHAEQGEEVHAPEFPRPPEIGGLWHNAFRDQIGKNAGPVEDLLAAAAPALLATGVPSIVEVGDELLNIAQSVPEAIEVSQLASAELLDIPVNQLPGVSGKPELLMVRTKQKSVSLGSMELTIVGPTRDELTKLRDGWDNWLRDNREKVRSLRMKLKERIESFSEAGLAGGPFDLRDWNGIEDYKNVTVPNIASLMFMVEEDGKRILLSGDSQQDIILKGLKQTGYLEDGYCHLDVLKVQHHASENNVDAKFCRTVSADHYVFCGNGEHGNPETSVLEIIYASRLGAQAKRALAPEAADRPFAFWFSTTSAFQTEGSDERATFEGVEELVEEMVTRSNGLLTAHFNRDVRLTLQV